MTALEIVATITSLILFWCVLYQRAGWGDAQSIVKSLQDQLEQCEKADQEKAEVLKQIEATLDAYELDGYRFDLATRVRLLKGRMEALEAVK